MFIVFSIFYGLLGLVILFTIIQYAVSKGIDSSEEVKALKEEVKEIRKQLKNSIK